MDDALLDLRLRVYGFYCLREACESVHAGDQDVLHSPVLKAVHNREPELGALIFSHIHAKDILLPFHVNPKGDIDSPLYNASLTADMIVDGIHEYHCTDFLQRAFLPFFHDGEYFVCDPADGAVGYIHVIEFLHVGFDISGRHSLCIHGKYFFLHVLCHGILIFFDELWFIVTIAVAGDSHLHIPVTGVHGLCRVAVPAVTGILVPVVIL